MNFFLQLQECICYTKNLITSLASEHSDKKVHQRRFIPILKRVLPFKLKSLDTFFAQKDKDTVIQFVKLMTQCGEIVHLGDGYYIVPPARHVQLPVSEQKITISLLNNPTNNAPGLIGQITDLDLPCIKLEDWAYAISPTELLRRYESELYIDPEFQPEEVYAGTPMGLRKEKNPASNVTYLLLHRPYKSTEKIDKYIGKKIGGFWHIKQIDNEHYVRIRFGLEIRHGKLSTYQIKPSNNDKNFILTISKCLPTEEKVMLTLIGFPEKWPDPPLYIIQRDYVEDAKAILSRLNMKEVE